MEKKKKAKQQQNVCILPTGNLHRQSGQWCVFKTDFLLHDYTHHHITLSLHIMIAVIPILCQQIQLA